MLYIRGHKIIKGYVGNAPVSHVGFGKSGLIKIKKEGNLIAKYTANTSGVLPTFNSGYQYTINEIESNDVYTVELFSDDDFTSCSFNNKSELLTVEYLKVTSKVTNMNSMFRNCSQLTQLDVSNWDTKNVTNMYNMWANCYKLTQLDLSNWNTSKVARMDYMFYGCSKLTQLDLNNFNTSKVTNMSEMFQYCNSLTDFIAPKNINANIGFNYCNNLSHDSLMSIVNNLATVTTTRTLTLGSTNLAKLSSEEKAIATNKGWTLA